MNHRGAPVVKISYEEQIINKLMHLEYPPGSDRDIITRHTTEFNAMREVLQPLYDELKKANELLSKTLPIIKPDAPLRWYKNDAVRDDVRNHLEEHAPYLLNVQAEQPTDEERRMAQYGTLHLCEVCTSGPSPYTPETCPNRKD